MNGSIHRGVLLVLTICCAVIPIGAQTDPSPPGESGDGDLQREMRRYFADRLRADLGLTDEQVDEIMPTFQELERERVAARRERGETLRQLRRGIEHGASDEELQAMLDRLDETERRQQQLKERLFEEIDRSLTVRQRVGLRFFVERFSRMMREKIDDLRRGHSRSRDPARAPYRRGGGERP